MRRATLSALAAVLVPAAAHAADADYGSLRDGFHGTGPLGLFFYLGAVHPVASLVAILVAALLAWELGPQLSGDPVKPLEGFLSGRGGGTGLEAELPGERLAAVDAVRARDPAFDEAAFLVRAAGAFRAVQDAWEREDMAAARAFVSDGVHERFRRRVAELRERGLRRRVRVGGLRAPEVLGYRAGEHYHAVYVGFSADAADELIGADGVAESGGAFTLAEVWTFLRRPGAATLARPGALEGFCPSCGAPLEVVDAATCAACKAWVNSGEHDWVLTESTAVSEWAFPAPDREVDGWRELHAADPDLSSEELEDRAAVAFWRWLDARRRGDPAPLKGVSTPDLLGSLAFDGTFARDAETALVETTACETGAEFERVHVQVRWKADHARRLADGSAQVFGREDRTDFLVFRRRAGATTDVRAGLRAARCPSCGGTPEDGDATVCAYCGRAFDDGTGSWGLDAVVPYGRWRRPESVDGPPERG